jgi:hypothetical protein
MLLPQVLVWGKVVLICSSDGNVREVDDCPVFCS